MKKLLATKFFIPTTRPEIVARPRLIEKMDGGLHRKLTLISAPAGFGKTTLVVDWLEKLESEITGETRPNLKFAWLSLGEDDSDTARFLVYVISALRTINENIGMGLLGALQSQQPPAAEAVLTALINEVSALSNRIVLVLDDYHLIDARSIHDALTFLLEHLPSQMHLVISTREDPLIPLSRLRVRGQLSELRASDLRFSSIEAAEFLTQIMGLSLSAEDIALLETRTEGWIAGLQLAAISMQSSQDLKAFIQSFAGSHRYVLDYLIEEVLNNQSEAVQDFLMRTSILVRLTGSLCDALTGREDGQTTLEMLEHNNLFVVPLDDERCWYRYHHLFADLLHQRLRQSQPDKLPGLHIRASEWFNQQGLNREAINHSLAAKDYEKAGELIGSNAIDIIEQGEHTTVVEWINTIPEDLVKENPYLCVLHAWALQLSGQFEATETRLIDAEKGLEKQNFRQEDVDAILGLIQSHRAYMSFLKGDHEKTILYARQSLEQLPSTASVIRVQTSLYLGIAYRYQGRLQEALDIYLKTLPGMQSTGANSTAILGYLNLAELYIEFGQLHQAKELLEQALNFTEQYGGRPDVPYAGYVYVIIGRIFRQWNRLDEAYRNTTQGVALARDWKVPEIIALSCIELAHIHQALGHTDEANESIQEAIKICEGYSPWSTKFAKAHQAKIHLIYNDLAFAVRWAEANDLILDGDFEYHRENEYLVLIRVWIAQQRWDAAHALAARIYKIAQQIGKKQTELEALILLALVSSGQGDMDQALAHMVQAIALGEPEGFVRMFVDEGPPMARLLYEALNHGIGTEYVRQLLAAFPNVEPEQAEKMKAQDSKFELFEPLSDRETEILQLISKGLTNPVIATRLYLSINTVKVHTRNIYAKLGVHNRVEAVKQARALGVIT